MWRIFLGGGEAEQITDEKGGVSSFDWSPDGASIAFVMTDPKTEDEEKAEKEKRDWRTIDQDVKMARLYVQPSESDAQGKRASRTLTTGDYSVEGFDWAPDGRAIAFQHQPTPSPNDWTRSDISVVTVADGAVRTLVASPAAEQSPRFSPDGTRLAFTMSDAPATWPSTTVVHRRRRRGRHAEGARRRRPTAQAGLRGLDAGRRARARHRDEPHGAGPLRPAGRTAARRSRVSPADMNVAGATLNPRGTHVGLRPSGLRQGARGVRGRASTARSRRSR